MLGHVEPVWVILDHVIFLRRKRFSSSTAKALGRHFKAIAGRSWWSALGYPTAMFAPCRGQLRLFCGPCEDRHDRKLPKDTLRNAFTLALKVRQDQIKNHLQTQKVRQNASPHGSIGKTLPKIIKKSTVETSPSGPAPKRVARRPK